MLTPSGEFDRQVTIEQNTPTKNSTMGGEVPSWSTFASGVWARFRETPVDATAGAQVTIDGAYRGSKVRIRYIDGITNGMRLNDDGALWEITGTAVLGRKAEIDLAVRDWRHK